MHATRNNGMRIFNKTSRKRGKKTNSISCYQGNPIRRHVRVHKNTKEKKTQTVSAEKIDPPTTASDLLFAGGDIKETFFLFLFSLINTMIIIITKRDFVT